MKPVTKAPLQQTAGLEGLPEANQAPLRISCRPGGVTAKRGQAPLPRAGLEGSKAKLLPALKRLRVTVKTPRPFYTYVSDWRAQLNSRQECT